MGLHKLLTQHPERYPILSIKEYDGVKYRVVDYELTVIGTNLVMEEINELAEK